MPTPIEEIKPVKYEFEYRKKIEKFSLEVSDYQDTEAREKNNDFLVQ